MSEQQEQAEPSGADGGSTFRAVAHIPSGERWILATDEVDGSVYPMGWPESRAAASDCRMVRSATDAQRYSALREVASSFRAKRYSALREVASSFRAMRDGDARVRIAAHQLREARELGREST
jgi:hypothetical protein